jgi:hypothetical protein
VYQIWQRKLATELESALAKAKANARWVDSVRVTSNTLVVIVHQVAQLDSGEEFDVNTQNTLIVSTIPSSSQDLEDLLEAARVEAANRAILLNMSSLTG